MTRALRRLLFALLVALAVASGARDAVAQPAPTAPAQLPPRPVTFRWDKTLLRATYAFRDAVDPSIVDRLSKGLPNVIAMRAYVYREGDATPVALSVQSCKIVYDLWDDLYRVTITDPSGVHNQAVANQEGVFKKCLEARELPIVDRSVLKTGTAHFLAVVVDVNPVDPQLLAQLRAWVTRPTGSAGSTGITPGDALFGSFVGLFVRNIGASDKTVTFRTAPFVP